MFDLTVDYMSMLPLIVQRGASQGSAINWCLKAEQREVQNAVR